MLATAHFYPPMSISAQIFDALMCKYFSVGCFQFQLGSREKKDMYAFRIEIVHLLFWGFFWCKAEDPEWYNIQANQRNAELFPDRESNSKKLHKLPMLNFIAGLLRSLSLQNMEAKASYRTRPMPLTP